MKRLLLPRLLAPFLAFAAPAVLPAADWTFDYRAPASAPTAEEPGGAAADADPGLVRRSVLAGAASPAPALAPGDRVTLLLFDGTEVPLRLEEAMPAPLVDGRVFAASPDDGSGVRTAVVIAGRDGLTATVAGVDGRNVVRVFPSGGAVVAEERDPAARPVEGCEPIVPDVSPPEAAPGPDDPAPPTAEQSDQLVDVLVAYEQGALSWVRQNGGMTNFAEVAVQRMNAALANTGLDQLFRFRLVGVASVNDTQTDVDSALEAAKGGSGAWAPLHAMRDAVGADTVTVLIDNGSAYGTTGLGYSLTATTASGAAGFAEYPYNACLVRSVAISDTMTHETGHNLGCGHSNTQTSGGAGPQSFSYSSGYHFVGSDGVRYHTIMAYYTDGTYSDYKPVPFFSSPEFQYAGVPVGTASANDNTRVLRQTYAWAGAWRARKIPLSYDVFFSPESGATFTDSIVVAMTPGKAGAEIRYTTDGTEPTLSSPVYTGPITLTQTTTIRAAVVTDGVLGPYATAVYSVSDLGAAVDAPQLPWRTSDTHPWTFQTTNTYDGADSAQSFDDGDYRTNESWLETTVTGPTDMSFRYKTRKYKATFSVLLDDAAVLTDTEESSGDDWTLRQISVPQGRHTVRFRFRCWIETSGGWSGGRQSGFNGAWLDAVQFDALSASPSILPGTTADVATATTFQNSLTVSILPPEGASGSLLYTLDGSDPSGPGGLSYAGPFEITASTRVRAVFVATGKEPSVPVDAVFLERHPVRPGEWTTDVAGARAAAAQDGALVAVLLANRAGCWWSQQFYPVAESPEFLSWCEANGVYLVTADESCNIDAGEAREWFDALYMDYGDRGTGISYPTLYFARPAAPDTAIGKGLARNNGSALVGAELYLDTAESLVAGFASVLGATIPAAPVCSEAGDLVDAFPLSVTLSNPNGSGTIYYTLDGSPPTRSDGTVCSGAIEIASSDIELRAAVWTGATFSSPVLARKFRTVSEWANGVFGTSGITWHRSGTVDWYQVGSEPTLRTGGLRGGEAYSSTITATVSGKGRLIYRYKAASWSSRNVISHAVNGVPQWSVKANYTSIPTVAVTNEVADAGETTFSWTYAVDDPSNDYTSGYTSGGVSIWSGAWIYDLRWIPERDGVEVEGVFLSGEWFADHFPGAAADSASRSALARADTDGDGFENWKECLCGTDPNDEADHLRATIRMENGEPVVGWNLTAPQEGATCIVEGAAGLPAAAADWTSPPPAGARFFRVRVGR